jgi:phospholipase/carboxylesterase
MLKYEVVKPDEEVAGAPLVVLLHGRGADERDLRGVARGLPQGSTLVTPRAPFSGREWGYGPGWAWYRYVAEDRVESETLERSLSELDDFLAALPGELGVDGPLVLGGFSQGGTTSVAWALRNPGRVSRIVNLSGFVVDDEGVEVSPRTVEGTAFFWGHGVHDPAIPHALAVRGRRRLAEAGAALEAKDYPIAHSIALEELRDLREWMKREPVGREAGGRSS